MSKESEFLLKNQLVMSESIIESIQTILDGEEVSDFALSFGIIREVFDIVSQNKILEHNKKRNAKTGEDMQKIYESIKKFKQWKKDNPDTDFQKDELHDFVSGLERSELWAIFQFVENNYDINLF
jgi:hypothetical protein